VIKKCGLENGDSCFALNLKNCDGCNFFKTSEQLKEDRQAVAERLKEKGLYEQMRKKYPYFGALEEAGVE
jgi:hypothetical protein